jgi:hypothetical protein
VNTWIGNGKLRKERESQRNCKEKQNENGQNFMSCESGEDGFDTPKEPLRNAREKNRGQDKCEREQNRNGWLGEPSGCGGIHQGFGKSPGQKHHRVIHDSIVVDKARKSAGKRTRSNRVPKIPSELDLPASLPVVPARLFRASFAGRSASIFGNFRRRQT